MMQFQQVARLWRIGAIATCVCMLVFAGMRLAADDSGPFAPDIPDAPAETETEEESVSLDEQIEITVNGGLRSRTRTEHSTSVTIRNISDEDIEGPLALVVDASGLDVLEVDDADGTIDSGEPYVEVLPESGTLRAGASLRPKRVSFSSEEAIPRADRDGFEPQFRVVRLTDEDRSSARAGSSDDENIPGKSYSQADMNRVMGIQERWSLPIMREKQDDVFGTAIAEDDQGNLVIRVFTSRGGVIRELPGDVEGIPLQQKIIGERFHAGPTQRREVIHDGKPVIPDADLGKEVEQEDDGDSEADALEPIPDPDPDEDSDSSVTDQPVVPIGTTTIRHDRPVPIGISAINTEALLLCNPVLCATGTFGCRCIDPMGNPYGLSNLHVFGTILLGSGNSVMIGLPGTIITQPGLGDNLCFPDLINDRIGVLADYEPIFTVANLNTVPLPINLMDAAVMLPDDDAIGFETLEDGYGAPQRDVAPAIIGLPVRKYGRTTGNTVGEITSVNAFVPVGYSDCNSQGIGVFIQQIEAANLTPFGSPFGQPGDSGSLVVEHAPGTPNDSRPVGLLFAGGPAGAIDSTICNPIGPILSRFVLQVDDGSGEPSNAGVSGSSGGALGPLPSGGLFGP